MTEMSELNAFINAPRVTLLMTNSNMFNSSPPGQNGRHFADDIFRCIFVSKSFCILNKISLKFAAKGPIDNKPVLV